MGPNHHGSSPQSIGNNDRNSYGIIDRVVMMIVDHTHRANNTPTKADRITITTVVHILAIKVRVRTHHKIIRQETMIRIHHETTPKEMIIMHHEITLRGTMIMGNNRETIPQGTMTMGDKHKTTIPLETIGKA